MKSNILDETPSPWRTLGRFVVRALLGAAAAVGLWGAWYGYAAHRLNARLADYRARGEPASAEELNTPPVPAAENQYDLLMAAADHLALNSDETDLVDSPTTSELVMLPLSAAQMQTTKDMVGHNAASLDLIKRASHAKALAFPPVTASDLFSAGIHHLRNLRRLVTFCYVVALYNHQRHRDDLAFDALRKMETVALMMNGRHFLIFTLLSDAMRSTTADAILNMAPDLELQSATSPYGVPRAEIVMTIRQLLDTQPLQDDLRASIRTLRLLVVARADERDESPLILRPALRLSAVRSLDQFDTLLASLGPGVPNYGSAASQFPRYVRPRTNLDNITYALLDDEPTVLKFVLLHYRSMTDQEAAALRLALRLYELDHENQLPSTLSDMVPQYLPRIPVDTFRRDGRALTYVPKRRMFYSVNRDGVDNGGLATPGKAGDWRAPDAVYSLDRVVAAHR